MRRVRHQQRETLNLTLPGGRAVELLRVRDPLARSLRLLISARGPRLTVPPGVSPVQERAFLHQNLPWLEAQLRQREAASTVNVLSLREATSLPLAGKQVPVEWVEGRFLRVEESDAGVRFLVPPNATDAALRRSLKEFYLGKARREVGRWLPHYLPGLPKAPREWKIRPLSSIWGSLSASGTMSLDLALILAPLPAFEYVLVHELCHLIQPNHSPAFWREVQQRCPQWRHWRAWFRGEGAAIKDALRNLIG